jgi:aminobenzoyl-glutamate utilization protein B
MTSEPPGHFSKESLMSIGQQSGKLIFLAATALAAAMVPLLGSAQTSADNTHALLQHLVDADSPPYVATSKMIWDNPELGFLEQKSSALLQDDLSKAGFKIRAGVAGQPTAFGEFDALPGLSQEASPVRKPRVAGAPGHACGHNLLGSGAALAAVALKQYLDKNHIEGTLRYYGTPAEEGGGGKVFMVRDGLFKDVDVVLTWHPGDRNAVVNGGALPWPRHISPSTEWLRMRPPRPIAAAPHWMRSC